MPAPTSPALDGPSSPPPDHSPERRCEACGRSFADDELFCPVDGAPLVARGHLAAGQDPYLGLVIVGQIEIQKLAGAGSMARVYKAHQRGVDRDVAVKILHRELSADPEIVRRFHQEAKVASRLSNPHLVNVYLTAELPKTTDDGQRTCGELVLVSEFLDGMSLLSALGAAGGALPLPRALHIVLQICDALAEAHRNGVVHRDVKPENVMLVQRGEDRDFVKVLDFGLARLATKDASFATRQGAIFGSPRYISPEGAQGLPVGPTADVYAVATLLYQMLAGRTPFEADSPVGFLLAHTSEKAPRVTVHERSAYVPEPIATLLDKNLQKDPSSRARDARALAADIREAAEAAGLSAEALVRTDAWLGAPGEAALALSSLQRTKSLALSDEARGAIAAAQTTGEAPSADDAEPTNEGESSKGHTLLAGEDDLPRSVPIVPTLFDAPSSSALVADAKPSARSRTQVLGEGPSAANVPTASSSPPEAIPDVPALEPPPSRGSRSSTTPAPPSRGGGATAILTPSTSPVEERLPTPGPVPAPAAPTTSPPAIASPHPLEAEPQGAVDPASPWRTAGFVALCFLFGGVAAMAGAARLGHFDVSGGARSTTAPPPGAVPAVAVADAPSADQLFVALASAEAKGDWEGSPNSVRGLLTTLERDHGADPRVKRTRVALSGRIVARAAEARQRNDMTAAARLCALAIDLDSDNTEARALATDLAKDAGSGGAPTGHGSPVSRPAVKPTGASTGGPPPVPTASSKEAVRWL